jgi:hypothetical protein
MKRIVLSTVLILVAVAGVACGRSARAEPVAAARTVGGTALAEDYADALSVPSQLIVGSLRLEESDLAVGADQAAELLPLWQAYQSLSNSDTTAEAEIEGLVKQIQETMSPAQVAAIAGMRLTAEDATAVMQVQGAAFGRGGQDSGQSGGQNSSSGGFGGFPAPPGGGFRGGGFRDGGGGGFRSGGFAGGGAPGGVENMTPEERATAVAERLGSLSGDLATRGLLNALITSLQVKTGEIDQADLQAQRALRGMLRWLPAVSEASGIPVETLRDEVAGGATLAEVVEAQGGDVAAVETALRGAIQAMAGEDSELTAEDINRQVDGVLHGTAETD